MTNVANDSGGVQSLIDRIRDDGVQAARAEADLLLKNARNQASQIVDQARQEADALRSAAANEIEGHRTAALDALQLAARDTVIELKARVAARFEEFIKRLVVSATHDEELVRNLVLVLAGHTASEFIQNKEMEIRISRALFGEETLEEEGNRALLALSSDMLREGVELIPDDGIDGGARVKLVDDQLEIDLSDQAISRMIAQQMIPRFRDLLSGKQ
ncbi:hypothetical protein LOC68_11145 [Blastopirellula sp. JC732]|uniref:V-type ATP synthase subunit E n=1 Tax=Blastopirellula sediminis TaxID=2894196 RepID=A0A9X1MMF9_9BACT|nr:hypothetical protein [Blastopirellula sediminis]MCC9608284.1 hypothetical protein [Blastopirellula sediminis]MCC9628955.1 hypothetical protein [Blastopirellula sediminis]